jgi:selenocysteine-specific elongation factor
MPEKEHVIVGTAGHIDHGKSSLVKALTGIDPDTLPEEKERGMTIELGFVFLDIPDYERQIIFIDVPGHEKFVKTMVAGASHVDAALLVVAADEGISVQTREHFDILQLLRIPVGMIALTKSDLVDEARLAELKVEVANFVKGTFLEGAAVIPASAVTNAGVPEVKETLLAIGRRTKKRPDSGFFRLPIDRVFTMRGFGTVIAGTALSGEIRLGDIIEIYPEGIRAKVRGIQVHKEAKEKSVVGRRTALNLQDVEKEVLRRGQVAAMPGALTPVQRLDARLRLLAQSPVELRNRDRVRLHIGTDELIGRVALLEQDRLRPGESVLAQLVLEAPAVALLGDRFVLRTFSPLTTIGGGEILDGTPPRHKRLDAKVIAGLKRWEGDTAQIAEQALVKSGLRPLSATEAARSLGRSEAEVGSAFRTLLNRGKVIRISSEKGDIFLLAEAYDQLRDKLLETVKKFFEERPQLLYMPHSDLRARLLKITDEAAFRLILDDLGKKNLIIAKNAQIGLPGREMKLARKDQEAIDRIERKFRTARFETPLEEDLRLELRIEPTPFRRLMQSLFQQGKLVRLNRKVVYHRETFEAARDAVVGHLQKTKSITLAELRDRLKMSRKYSHAILEYFDRTGLTKRVEDRHVLRSGPGG